MSAAHTPGPWAVDPFIARVVGQPLADDGEPLPIAQMLWPTDWRTEDETFSNARLIAAAPELLEALKRLCSFDPVPTQDDWDDARVIIAKAEGRA